MSNVRVTVSIEKELKEQLDQFAEKNGLDRSAALEKVLEGYFQGGRNTSGPQRPVNPEPTKPQINPTPTPQPQIPGQLLRDIEELKTLTKRLDKENREMRLYLTHAYPAWDAQSQLLLAHHVFLYGLQFQGAVIPAPPWWDPKKAPLNPILSLPDPKAKIIPADTEET